MRRVVGWVVLSLLLGAPGLARDSSQEPVLLWRLKSLGIDPQIAQRVSTLLAREIERLDGVRLISPNALDPFLKERPELGRCGGQRECLTEIGRLVGAERVVSGVLGKLGDSFSLDLKLVDVHSGIETGRIAQTWGGGEESLIEVMRLVATRALRPEAYLGRVALLVNVAEVKVFLDGDFVGRTPLASPLQAPPGRHALKLVRDGYRDHERFVDVVFDRALPVEIEMQDVAVRDVVQTVRDPVWLAVGLKGGLMVNWQDLLAPQVMVDAGWLLPFWSGRLGLQLATGVYGSKREETAAGGALGRVAVSGELLVWPVQLGLTLRPLRDVAFSPYLSFSGCLYVIWQTLEPEAFGPQTSRDLAFGFLAAAGLEYEFGPGAILLEVGYQFLELGASGSGFAGNLGGVAVQLGYRLML